MKVEIEIPDGLIPKGLEPTGEFRKVRKGEWFLTSDDAGAWRCDDESGARYIILRKVEPVRESRWRWVPDLGASHIRERTHDTKEKAGINSGCVIERIDYENGKPVAVTLEPVEEQ